MIYDCFTFFNELDLLEIRLNVLDNVVDKFVLVEMSKTHTGKDKAFVFEENKQRFAKFLNKIIHIKVDKYPCLEESEEDILGNKWILENYQRDLIMEGLVGCNENDIIMISDLDEIPNPKVVKKYKGQGIWVLEQRMMYYYINNICYTNPTWRSGTRISTLGILKDPKQHMPQKEFYQFSSYGLPTYFRFCKGKYISNGGWHFSYCGGVDAIIKKRQAIVEQQFNNEKNMSPEYIEKKIKMGQDILDRDTLKYRVVPLDNSFPKYIIENKLKYKHLIINLSNFDKILYYICNGLCSLKKFLFYKEKDDRHKKIYILGIKIFSYKRKKYYKN